MNLNFYCDVKNSALNRVICSVLGKYSIPQAVVFVLILGFFPAVLALWTSDSYAFEKSAVSVEKFWLTLLLEFQIDLLLRVQVQDILFFDIFQNA